MIFQRFPTTFRRFPKIFQNCSEGQTNVPEHFPRISENSQQFPKIAEDYRGRPEDVSMIYQPFQVQFKRQTWYQWNHWYLHMWGYHIFTCEDIVSFLWICYQLEYHWFYIIKRTLLPFILSLLQLIITYLLKGQGTVRSLFWWLNYHCTSSSQCSCCFACDHRNREIPLKQINTVLITCWWSKTLQLIMLSCANIMVIIVIYS